MQKSSISGPTFTEATPPLTVVIPVWNRPDMVLDAVASVINQDCDDEVEIVVVDDGSSDATVKILQDYIEHHATPSRPIRLVEKAHSGISATIGRGVREACGRYVCLLGSDDIWEPSRARELLNEEHRLGGMPLIHTNWQIMAADLSLVSSDGMTAGGAAAVQCVTSEERRRVLQTFASSCFRKFSLHGGTIIFPRTMLGGAFAIPDNIVNEDFWITLVAYLTTPVYYLSTNSVRVRTHRGQHHRLTSPEQWPRIAEQEVHMHAEMIQLIGSLHSENRQVIDFLAMRQRLLILRQAAAGGARSTCIAKTTLLLPRCLSSRGLLRTAFSNIAYSLSPALQSWLRGPQ
jgi:hypothetical protein